MPVDAWIPDLDGEPTPPRPRQRTPIEDGLLADQTRLWEKQGVVEVGKRIMWTNNPVFVAKKNGTTRVCIDCRPANAVTKKLDWPLLKLQELRHRLKGMRWFTRIDLKDAFFRIAIPEEWRHLTAYESGGRFYQFKRMPFGLKTAPAVFQRWMDHILKHLSHVACWYMDDVLVYAETLSELHRRTRKVRAALVEARCRINEDKSLYDQQGLLFGGLWLYPEGVGPNYTKVREALALAPPRTKKDKQSALGLVSYLRDFIPLLSILTADLSGTPIDETEYQRQWSKLMRHISHAVTTLKHWQDEEDADLYTDASGTGAAAVLIQDGRIIAVASRKLQGAETRYSATDREHLSLLLAAQKFRVFLHRQRGNTNVWNDHAALMNRQTNDMTPRQARWFTKINQWIPNVAHVKGSKNPADFFSRWGVDMTGGQIRV
jgi:hypothetical protein